jgi:hypothetical protein
MATREPITRVRTDGVEHAPRRAERSSIVTLLDEAVGLGGHGEDPLGDRHLQRRFDT